MTILPLDKLKIVLLCEVDEMWSFVIGKKLQRWLWYAWEPRLKRIIAHAFGDRSTETTLGYSKSADMHDKVIGTFIERNYYL